MSENEDSPSANTTCLGNSLAVEGSVEQVNRGSGPQKERRYFCKICDIRFCTFPSLKDHLSTYHTIRDTKKSYFCQSCEKSFSCLAFQIHLHREHTAEKIDSCIKCHFKLPHVRVIPTRRSGEAYSEHYCVVCQAEMNAKKREEKEGTKTHGGGEKEIPPGKDVDRKVKRKICESRKNLTCELCQVRYATSQNLNHHLLSKHGVRSKEQPHHCGICQKGFFHLGTLRMHRLKEHIEAKPYVCGVCSEKFAREDQLQRHSLRLHPPKKSCDVCLKEVSSAYMRIHMRIHLGIKPYSCVACDRRFESSGRLRIHLVSHTGEKPHVCETCNRGFSRKRHLNTHMLLHTGEKPYVCDFCQRGFTQKWVMVAHRRTHTGERPFECHTCQRGFIYKSQLKTHNCKGTPPE